MRIAHSPQSLEWSLKIMREDTREVLFDNVIRHDTVFERDKYDRNTLIISSDNQEVFKIKLDDTSNLNKFIYDVERMVDPEVTRVKGRFGDINSFTEGINSKSSTYYFISVFKNKKDLSYARGSVVKAFSIASKYR